jgi:anthranilate/para-aminobenzoate synthase component II
MRTLLIDNYDSLHIQRVPLARRGLRRGAYRSPQRRRLVACAVALGLRCDRPLPGPGRPERWHDFGVCADILRQSEVPVLGVCLGHQGIGQMLEGHVDSAPVVMHGRLSRVRHDATGLFAGIPQQFTVVRYHSLVVGGNLGAELAVEHRRTGPPTARPTPPRPTMRNDLGRVCELGSVRVPELMVVEKYATVHQLISTITGKVDSEHTPVQMISTCFPGGVDDGRAQAPPDEHHRWHRARGARVNSGSIVYFELDGTVDMNSVIGTIAMRPARLRSVPAAR